LPDEVVKGIDVSVYMGDVWTWFVLRRSIRPSQEFSLLEVALTQQI